MGASLLAVAKSIYYLMEPITLGTSYYTCAFCKRPTLATLVFKLWEGSCTESLNNRPV